MEKFKCFTQTLYSFGNLDFSAILEDISSAEYIILSKIEEYTNKNKVEYINVTKLSEELKVSTPAVSRILKGLETKKLLSKTVDIFCKRNTKVKLTEAGTKLVEKSYQRFEIFFEEIFKESTSEEQEVIIETLKVVYTKMYDNLQKYKGVI